MMDRSLHIETDGLYYGNVLIGDAYREVDGYYVFVPGGRGAAWSSSELKMVAEFLDEINEPWDKQIQEYFENN